MAKYPVQVSKENYKKDYLQLPRWISYYYQIKKTLDLNPTTVLEIGIGDKTYSNFLKERGIKITTCDFDAILKPEVIADIRNLPFKPNRFDIISCFEVLEHIRYEEFLKVLISLKKISKKYVLISVPHPGSYISFLTRFRGLKKLTSKEYLSKVISISPFYKNKFFDGQHYWEIGWKNYPYSKIKKDIEKEFKILESFKDSFCPIQRFFILEKK